MKNALLVLLAGAALTGCSTIGSDTTFDSGKASIRNGSPVVLDIRDANKVGTASGVGPARYTSITGDRIETMQTGTTPRDAYAEMLPDGTVKFNVSSGTDIRATGVKFNPDTRLLEVAEFSTLASDPLKTHNEAYDRLAAYWASRDEASKQAVLAQIDAIKAIAPEFVSLLSKALGVP